MNRTEERVFDMKQKIAIILAAALCVGMLSGCDSIFGTTSKSAQSGQNMSSAVTASEGTVSSGEVSSEPVSSAPPAPVGDVTDTVAGGHYNNNTPAYYSQYVLVCGDYALEIFSSAANAAYAKTVSDFAAKYPKLNVSCAIVPKSSAFNIPTSFSNLKEASKNTIAKQYEIQKKFIDGTYQLMSDSVNTVDVMGEMTPHTGEYMYYRTDHHWTSRGAYYASAAYCKANGIAPRSINEYKTVRTDGYIGSMYSFCGKPKPECLKTNPDSTIGRLPAVSYTMTYTRDGTDYAGSAINDKASGYMMFICGDQPYTKIITQNKTGKKLLIFKESFGNAFVPYMIDYYDEIYVVDIRETTPNTSAIIADKGITDVLFINNVFAAADANQIKRVAAKAAS